MYCVLIYYFNYDKSPPETFIIARCAWSSNFASSPSRLLPSCFRIKIAEQPIRRRHQRISLGSRDCNVPNLACSPNSPCHFKLKELVESCLAAVLSWRCCDNPYIYLRRNVQKRETVIYLQGYQKSLHSAYWLWSEDLIKRKTGKCGTKPQGVSCVSIFFQCWSE